VAFVQPPAAGYVYTPSVCLNCTSDVFIDYLFCQPACGCYLFGDYYAQNYLQAGCYPCFAYHMSKFGYDPCYAYCSWQHHSDPNWHNTLLADYKTRASNPAARPPQTFAGLLAQAKSTGGKAPTLALPLKTLATQSKTSSMHFTTLTASQRQQFGRTVQTSRTVAARRNTLEKQSQVRPPSKVAQNTPNRTTTGPNTGGTKTPTNQPKPGQGGTQPRPVTNNTRTPQNNQPKPRPVTNNTRMPQNNQPQPRPVTNNTRTPTVTQRRPVATNTRPVTTQKGAGEHPVQRLTNPQYSPRPSNQGRTQPAPKRR
jgi:hypothetical protein